MRLAIKRFFYSFPIQLVIVLLKANQILLLYWVILFGWIVGGLSKGFGIPFLFLDPEYMGHVGFSSFFIMGFAAGSFIMVFNISSYIINGSRFPFIATLARPFMKYTINNFIVPVSFILVYLGRILSFQFYNEFQNPMNVIMDTFGFLLGLTIIVLFTLFYFFRTSKDIVKMFGMEASDANPNAPMAEHLEQEKNEKRKFLAFPRKQKEWRVDTYLSSPFKVKLVRRSDHYPKEMVESVFRQNHVNAAIIEVVVFGVLVIMGSFKDYSFFQIPAGASIFLIFSMLIMISSAFRFWLKTWTTSVFIILILLLNFISRFGVFYSQNKAYGLDYNAPKVNYSLATIYALNKPTDVDADYKNMIGILEKWKNKFSDGQGKPKMVFINCSGGGLRSSEWVFRVMQVADSLTNNNFSKSAEVITGASGGMIGAAYYRELYLQHQADRTIKFNSNEFLYKVAGDLLNPVAFSLTMSDLFFNIQRHKEGGTEYLKDRAYAFEKQLNSNTGYVFRKTLADYKQPEADALIPLMIFSPTIVTDGRRLMMSPQPISFLCSHRQDSAFEYRSTIDELEFGKLFRDQSADSIRFTTVLRMNATFPYILPAVNMPTEPPTQVMDAGIRDVTGLKTSLRFLYVFRKWIEENTSGVIFVDIRDSHKMRHIEKKPRITVIENFVTPLSNIYGNLLTIQDYNQDESYEYARAWFKGQFDLVTFELPTKEEDISLSWHLTTREKNSVYHAASLKSNSEGFDKLKLLLNRQSALTVSKPE